MSRGGRGKRDILLIVLCLFNCFIWKTKQKQPTKKKTFTSAYNMGEKLVKICGLYTQGKKKANKMTTDNFSSIVFSINYSKSIIAYVITNTHSYKSEIQWCLYKRPNLCHCFLITFMSKILSVLERYYSIL